MLYVLYEARTPLGGGVSRCPALIWHTYDIGQSSQISFTKKIIFVFCFDTLKMLNMYINNVINEELKILILIRIFVIFLNNKSINKIKFYHIYSGGVSVLYFLYYRCRSVLSCRVVSWCPCQILCDVRSILRRSNCLFLLLFIRI
jgi:hypothetical protein